MPVKRKKTGTQESATTGIDFNIDKIDPTYDFTLEWSTPIARISVITQDDASGVAIPTNLTHVVLAFWIWQGTWELSPVSIETATPVGLSGYSYVAVGDPGGITTSVEAKRPACTLSGLQLGSSQHTSVLDKAGNRTPLPTSRFEEREHPVYFLTLDRSKNPYQVLEASGKAYWTAQVIADYN